MKHVLLTLCALIFTIVVKGQSVNIDSCGLDNKSKLTKWEIVYFKESIEALRSIDLENKIFAFASGNFGNTIITKKDYFDRWGRKYYNNKNNVVNTLIVLTKEEKQLSGGYNYIIISWTKILPAGKSRKKLIERVRGHSEGNSHTNYEGTKKNTL
ncbi:MAG: hypothetical protein JWQ25_1991 [Daejeonella sp.]|nr:hypothetical protein [Daejeonella sp.]